MAMKAEKHHSTWSRRPRAQGDDGAALVEFALVMPLLFLLLFGIVEFGINMNDYQAIRQGVRDAARQAVVADYGTGSCAPATTTAADNSAAVQCTASKALRHQQPRREGRFHRQQHRRPEQLHRRQGQGLRRVEGEVGHRDPRRRS